MEEQESGKKKLNASLENNSQDGCEDSTKTEEANPELPVEMDTEADAGRLSTNFVDMIVRNADKDSESRRYSMEERLLCQAIYKRSPEAYSYLDSFLPLPSPSTLKTILTKIPLDTGVTETMSAILEDAAKRFEDPLDKICVLMWHEVSLQMHVQYSTKKDKIIGLEDWGTTRADKSADRAIVFTLRGIKTGWRIPLSYYFWAGEPMHDQLAVTIKDVVRAVTRAGFMIAASICRYRSSNRKAIESLQIDTDRVRETKNSAEYYTVLVDDVEFVPLFDTLDILKCFCDNLITKHLEFDREENAESKNRKFAQWNHVVKAYLVDLHAPSNNRVVPKLTKEHVLPKKNSKTSSEFVMQVFSNRLSSFMYVLARSPADGHSTNIALADLTFECRVQSGVVCYLFDNSPLESLEAMKESDYLTRSPRNPSNDSPFIMDLTIDSKRQRFPFCIVWTPIPLLTYFFPFIGHMGIATSTGIIRDFAGPYHVSEDKMAFGEPTKYWQLDHNRAKGGPVGWDAAVAEASEIYKTRMHNLCCDNCHSHVATALNFMNYGNSSSWNMVKLAFFMLVFGKYVSFWSFIKTWLPFSTIVALITLYVMFCV